MKNTIKYTVLPLGLIIACVILVISLSYHEDQVIILENGCVAYKTRSHDLIEGQSVMVTPSNSSKYDYKLVEERKGRLETSYNQDFVLEIDIDTFKIAKIVKSAKSCKEK